jgi:hypothetical protein
MDNTPPTPSENRENEASHIRSVSVPFGTSPPLRDATAQDRKKANASFSSVDSFDLHLFSTRQHAASFSSPNIPKINRKTYSYGTLSTPFADLDQYVLDAEAGGRGRGRSEHMDEEPAPSSLRVDIDVRRDKSKCGDSTLSPTDWATGRNVHRGVAHYNDPSSQLLRGDYQLRSNPSLGWAEAGTPSTNQQRKLRQLSTAFDQYVRSRRKVIFLTCGMAAAFTFLCAMTSRMAGGSGGFSTAPASNNNVPPSELLPTSSAVAAWYLSLCYLSAAISCVTSFLFLWWMSVRKRVTVSMLMMMIPLLILIMIETSSTPMWSNNPGYPIIVMVLCGASWGMFFPSALSLLTPHGPNTKLWLTIGIPFGTLVVEVLFIVSEGTTSSYRTDAVTITGGIAISLIVLGLCVHMFGVPNVHVDHNGDSVHSVCSAVRNVCMWVRFYLIMGCFALFLSSAVVSMFSVGAVSMALETHATISLFGGASEWIVPQGLIMGLYASLGLIGSVMGRKMAYMVQTTTNEHRQGGGREWRSECVVRMPLTWVFITMLGGGVIAGAFKVNWGVLLPLGVFLLAYGQGFVTNMMVRYIDSNLPREVNLAAFTLLVASSLCGSMVVWSLPVWVDIASWMGSV